MTYELDTRRLHNQGCSVRIIPFTRLRGSEGSERCGFQSDLHPRTGDAGLAGRIIVREQVPFRLPPGMKDEG